MAKDRMKMINSVLSDIGKGFQADYQLGREDATKMYYRTRELEGKQEDAPRATNLINTHMGINRTRELIPEDAPLGLGKLAIGPEKRQALNEADMALRGNTPHKIGQFLGSAAADLTQDTSRSMWWLINAAQAVAEIANEQVVSKAVPELYARSGVPSKKYFTKETGKPKKPQILNRGNEDHVKEMMQSEPGERPMAKLIDGKLQPSRGYYFDNKTGDLQKRNYSAGMIGALAIPTGATINNALGLLTPGGGMEGYKAAVPSDEDPTKTENVVAEVGLKYLLGQTGGLLPYNEFVKVRPDVSKDEYDRYQAFKYDKGIDLNPLDGDINLAGAVKLTDEGIHGPEFQMLGRSVPLTTGAIPFATALAGTAAGAKYGQRTKQAAIGGLAGGTGGALIGTAMGNIIEGERRRRNSVENQMEGGNAEQYL